MANGEPTPVDPTAIQNTGWMSDVQRMLAMLIIGILCFATAILVARLTVSADVAAIIDIAKIMLAALVNMGLVALGFFFGNTSAKMSQDAGQQKVVDKLTSNAPPAGPVAPVPATVVVVSWWSLMTPDEQAAIEAAAKTESKIKTIHEALMSGKAEPPDIAALVAAGLLKPERAANFKTA